MGIRTGTMRHSGAPTTSLNARGGSMAMLRDGQAIFDDTVTQQNPSPLRLRREDGQGYLINIMELPTELKLRAYHVITKVNADPREVVGMCCISEAGVNDFGYIFLDSPMVLGGTVWEMDIGDSMRILPAVVDLGFAIVRKADDELATASEMEGVYITFGKTQLEGMHYPFNYLIGGA